MWIVLDERKKCLNLGKDLDHILDRKESQIFNDPFFNVFLMTLVFLVYINLKVISRSLWIFYVCNAWPLEEMISFWETSRTYSGNKNSWIFVNIPSWTSAVCKCFLVIYLFLTFLNLNAQICKFYWTLLSKVIKNGIVQKSNFFLLIDTVLTRFT